jgi:hypothetical protein
MCPNCGNEEAIMAQGKVAEVSMPPANVPYEQKETALPYNPGAYEDEVESMHPAAQYTYQRAVAQGAAPQAAMAAAQEKQGEMMKRTQEGQNTEGVQIPVVGQVTAVTMDEEDDEPIGMSREEWAEKKGRDPVKARERDEEWEQILKKREGFVSASTIKRVSHLITAGG